MSNPEPQLRKPLTRRRRPHRKSKQGCAECKARHIKCDERRPSCANCLSSERKCVFPVHSSPNSAPSPGRGAINTACDTTPSESGVNAGFTIVHLTCLHHAEVHMEGYMALHDSARPIIEMAIETAATAPFLLNQVLALSALHLSSEASSQQSVYYNEATELQIRALGLFNRYKEKVSDTNRLSLFVFATLLGIHVIRETLVSIPDTISAFIETFVRYLRLHRGVRTFITPESWDQIVHSNLRSLLHLSHLSKAVEDETPGTETSRLSAFLETYDSHSEMVTASQSALRWIQWMLDLSKHDLSNDSLGIHSILAWAIVIPEEYIAALNQHRPEALAVLAFYAAAMHRYRKFWVFGESGSVLLDLIAGNIGSFWLEYLDMRVERASEVGSALAR